MRINTGVEERLELLDALAADIRLALSENSFSDGCETYADFSVHLDLIRHLASRGDRGWREAPAGPRPIREETRLKTTLPATVWQMV